MDPSGSQSDLKHWLIHKLTPICDADPSVLSEYVMALLKPEEPEAELIASCQNRLEDFLQAETKPFVADLFDHLRHMDRPSPAGPYQPALEPSGMSSTSPSVVLGKRPLLADHFLLSPAASLNPLAEPPQGSLTSPPIPQYTPTQSHPSFLHFPDAESRSAFDAVPTAQIQPFVSPPHQSRVSKRPRRSGMCRDYHYRGYCARGDGCLFSHDDRDAAGGAAPPFAAGYRPERGPPDAAPSLAPGPSLLGQHIPGLSPPLAFPPEHAINHYPPGPGARPTRFGAPPPAQRKSTTTLVVENIPPGSLSDRAVRAYFSTFGSLSSVSVDVYNAQALVTFEAAEDARRAYGSPAPVFNNRFVKIHFKRITDSGPRRGGHGHVRGGRGGAHIQVGSENSVQPTHPDQSGGPADCVALSEREKELRVKIDAQKRALEQLRLKKELKKAADGNGNGVGGEGGADGEEEREQRRCSRSEVEGEESAVGGKDQSSEQPWAPEPQPTDSSVVPPTLYKRPLSSSQPQTPRPFVRRPLSSTTPLTSRAIVGNTRTSWTPNGHTVNGSAGGHKGFYKIDNRAREVLVVWGAGAGREGSGVEKVRSYLEQFGAIEESQVLANKNNNHHHNGRDQNGSNNHDDENDEGDGGSGGSLGEFRVKFSTRIAAEKVMAQATQHEVAEVGRLSIRWFQPTPSSLGVTNGPSPAISKSVGVSSGTVASLGIPGLRSTTAPVGVASGSKKGVGEDGGEENGEGTGEGWKR